MDLCLAPTFGYEKLEEKKNQIEERMEEKYRRKFAESLIHLKLSVVE